MAGIVKWLRPRIVVPLCVGSNPTTRPIYKTSSEVFFVGIQTVILQNKFGSIIVILQDIWSEGVNKINRQKC